MGSEVEAPMKNVMLLAMKMEDSSEQSRPERTIMTPKHLRSSVWKHFGFYTIDGKVANKDKAVCRLCAKQLSYSTTTTNLRTHLLACHPSEAAQAPQTSGAKSSVQARLTAYDSASALSASAGPMSEARKNAITDKIARFICKDMRPIDIVSGEGFQDLIMELEPQYKIPSHTTISKHIVQLYDTTRENIKTKLKDKTLALTTDGWTSLATHAYVTVTAHCISDSWELDNYVLCTKELRGSHTAVHVAESISSTLEEFDISREAVVAVATDNALNYVNAIRNLGLINVPCFAHMLNLAVRKGLEVKAVDSALSRLKQTAAHFGKSPSDSCLLEEKQELLGLKKERLINDCITRWNTTYDMICRASQQQAAVAAVIWEKKLSNLELSTSEWSMVEQLKDTLKPFKVATQALSTDAYPTASAVLPLQHVMIFQLSTPDASHTSAMKEVRGRMVANLKMRYREESSEWMLLNKAAFMDPRFSRLVHLSPEQRHLVTDSLSQEMEENKGDDDYTQAREEEEKTAALGAMGSLFGDLYSDKSSGNGDKCNRDEIQEMQAYMKETPLSADSNPLLWWRDTGCNRYPLLSKLARKYLCVPGTSLRSERVFSSAGNIVNTKRAALDPDQVDRLVFLTNIRN
ncbi:E3 SUMO-protein ligase ZBED1-like [Sebastes umbrosus]|uniref:E3 SUMO-protein ligase ZBED1-like n=1 Tax=Sebastes umbrosus TaxID=72105 RepID=UPI00189EAD86|nr:E3 SUMO-protein ligase ZBED1-like [Sebastes umbrosus]